MVLVEDCQAQGTKHTELNNVFFRNLCTMVIFGLLKDDFGTWGHACIEKYSDFAVLLVIYQNPFLY